VFIKHNNETPTATPTATPTFKKVFFGVLPLVFRYKKSPKKGLV